MSRIAHRFVALSITLLASGCCAEPWETFPDKTPPDVSCSTGDVHGHDVYIWECLRGQRVAVAKYSAEFSCRAPERSTAPCGGVTALESSIGLKAAHCTGPRSGRAWRP